MNNLLTLYTCCQKDDEVNTFATTCNWYETVEQAVASVPFKYIKEGSIINIGTLSVPDNHDALVKVADAFSCVGCYYKMEIPVECCFNQYTIIHIDVEKLIDWVAVPTDIFRSLLVQLTRKYGIEEHNLPLFTRKEHHAFESYMILKSFGKESKTKQAAYTALIGELKKSLAEKYFSDNVIINKLEVALV